LRDGFTDSLSFSLGLLLVTIGVGMLYKGDLNLNGQCFTLYTHSKAESSALLNFIHQLHKKTGMPKRQLRFVFDGSKDNYRITKEGK